MKLANLTKVKVNMYDGGGSNVLYDLLNSLEGQIVFVFSRSHPNNPNYLVAYPLEATPAIQTASNTVHGVKHHEISIVGKNRKLNRPKDGRYYMIAFNDEVTPI